MGHMLHRATGPSEQKVFLATPAYSGVEAGYTFALFESVKALEAAGIGSELALFANDCHVDDSRNRLVRQFLMTDCTDLVFLDSDLRWEAKDLVKLLSFDVDVVGSTYPLKQEKEDYPVRLKGDLENGLYEAEALPTGFLRIKRHVLETLAKEAQKYMGKADHSIPTPLIFERTIEGSARWGGDYTFCRKWAKHGKLYLYPDPIFEHVGNKRWTGSYSSFVERARDGAIVAGLNAIREGRATPESYWEMVKAWGNEWSGDGDLLSSAVMLGAGKKVLECGSGLTTLCLAAAGAEVLSLEHSGKFAELTAKAGNELLTEEEQARINIHVTPLKDGFYPIPEDHYDLCLVDGPPRAIGDRSKAQRISADIFLSDDGEHFPMNWKKLTERVSVGYSTTNH